jgi:hypothetical protein
MSSAVLVTTRVVASAAPAAKQQAKANSSETVRTSESLYFEQAARQRRAVAKSKTLLQCAAEESVE